MPELAAAYAVGILSSLLLTGLFLFLWSRYRSREAAITLAENLKLVNLYWSDREDRLKPWDEVEFRKDREKAFNSLLATSVGLSFLSWAGFFFILLLMISYRFLARSRLENRLFNSPLANETRLSRSRVSDFINEVRNEFPQT